MAGERAVLIEASTAALHESMQRINAKLRQDAQLTFAEWLNRTLALFKAERLIGPPGVKQRSGTLLRSWYTTIEGSGLDQVGAIGSRARYAKVLEYGTAILPGGKIVPKRAKALAIPIPGSPAVTEAQVFKLGTRSLREVLPQQFPDVTFFVTGSGDKAVLMGQKGDAEAEPWFVLMRSVTFGPKLGLTRTVKKYLSTLVKSLAKVVGKPGRG